jgi:hypothetical protein
MARRRNEEWFRLGPQPLDLGPQRRWPVVVAIVALAVVIVVALVAVL